MRALAVVTVCALALLGCGGRAEDEASETTDSSARAERLAREIIIVDTHVDVPYRLFDNMEDISQRTEGGHFDHPRAVEGGLNAPFMSIYVPAAMETEGAKKFREEYWKDRERITGDVSDAVAHINHVIQLVGVDHVGFGSDFDGVATVPRGLEDVSFYPNLIRAL